MVDTIPCRRLDLEQGLRAALQGRAEPEDLLRALERLAELREGGEERTLADVLRVDPGQTAPTIVLRPSPDSGGPTKPLQGTRYSHAHEIARGGMGVILSAEDPGLGRKVAIKVLAEPQSRDGYSVRKLAQEGRITGTLEHPNIVPVHELGTTEDGRPFFAMKLVRGISLDRVLREGPTDRPRLLRDFLKVCDAVAFAHSRGILHRDLKPANIMIGEFGEVLVMDWGLAKVEGEEDLRANHFRFEAGADELRTVDGMVIGTPSYMSPEQARGEVERIDRRSDIYSLGAILYEILSGVRPYPVGDILPLLRRVGCGELDPPSKHRPIPHDLEAVVLKAMALDPKDRYPRVESLKSDIEAYLDGRILSAASYTPFQRMGKWVRRHRAASLAAVAVLGLAGLFLVGSRWQSLRETRRRVAVLRSSLGVARAEFAKIEVEPLRESNEELRDEVVDLWFDRQGKIVDLLDESLKIQADAPLGEERLSRCRQAWRRATEAGLFSLARSWLGRARSAGLNPEEADAARTWIDQESRRYDEETVRIAKERLSETEQRAMRWKPDAWVEACVYEFLRRRCPALVRTLLDPIYLDHRIEAVRLLAIQALGRLGDTRTIGAESEDAVEALSRRLRDIDEETDPVIASALADALARLGDSRAHALLAPRLARESEQGDYGRLVRTRLRDLPLPEGGSPAPSRAAEFLGRGMLYSAREQWEQALSDFDRALALDPKLVDAMRHRGRVFRSQGRTEEALAEFVRAIETDPQKSDAYFDRADLEWDRRRFPTVLETVEKLLAVVPQSGRAYVLRGKVHWELGNLEKAQADFERALQIDYRNAEAHIGLGRIARARRDLERAIWEFDLAVALDPEFASGAYLHRGLARAERGDRSGAIRDFTNCVRINGSHVSAFFNRAQLFEQSGQTERALVDYELCHRSQVFFWPAWYARGALLHRLGRREDAIAAFEGALKHGPEERRAEIEQILAKLRSP